MKLIEITGEKRYEALEDDYSTLLLEGGMALKGCTKISQVEARHLIPDLIKKIAAKLEIPASKIKNAGSAGKKPHDQDISGDIDLAVEAPRNKVEQALADLAYDDHRAMPAINVYSFNTKHLDKLIQVDLIPVDDLKYAEWSYLAHNNDLKMGLKGAHRNELFFAVAKHANRHVLDTDKDGEPVEVERYFYDLSKGLMTGKATRKGKRGTTKTWTTTDKHVLTKDPEKIARILFGSTAEKCSTFKGTLAAIRDDKFPYPDLRDKMLDTAREGIRNKGLRVPQELLN